MVFWHQSDQFVNPSSEAVQPGRVTEPIRKGTMLRFRGGGCWRFFGSGRVNRLDFFGLPLRHTVTRQTISHTSVVVKSSSFFVQPSDFVAFRHSHSAIAAAPGNVDFAAVDGAEHCPARAVSRVRVSRCAVLMGC